LWQDNLSGSTHHKKTIISSQIGFLYGFIEFPF